MRFLTIAFLVFQSSVCYAAPSISGAIAGSDTITITGTGFGTKSTAAPVKYTNFEDDTIGQVPTGWDAPQTYDSLVSNAAAYGGSKSLDSSAINKTNDYFPRISYDLGSTVPLGGYIYLSAWLYIGKTTTTATDWNWKGPIITSSNNPYYWPSGTSNDTAAGFAGFYTESGTPRWYNTAATVHYSQNGTIEANYGTNNGWNASSFVFGSWQRVEWIFKSSSAAGVADGTISVTRIGAATQPLTATAFITHGNTSSLWRYVSIPQGFTNISGGTLNLDMYWDDIYIDTTPQRVELCDASTRGASTKCELQLPTAWSDTETTVSLNTGGSFAAGDPAYLIVYNASNEASSGRQITIPGDNGGYRYRLRIQE